jgi:hypothetical protein
MPSEDVRAGIDVLAASNLFGRSATVPMTGERMARILIRQHLRDAETKIRTFKLRSPFDSTPEP